MESLKEKGDQASFMFETLSESDRKMVFEEQELIHSLLGIRGLYLDRD